jgi:hypothetical protein
MNTKRSLGILLKGGIFDKNMRGHMRDSIEAAHGLLKTELGRKPTQTELGDVLGMDRWRLARIIKGLEIIGLFG